MKKQFVITKSRYVECYKCPLKLWLYKNKPSLKEENSLSDQMNMEEGNKIGRLATTTEKFKNGVEVPVGSRAVAVATTKKLIKAKTKIIYEASFKTDIAYCQADILVFEEDGFVDLYEVKASNRVKSHHLVDIAFQKWVIEQSGIKIRNCFLVHLNTNYSFNNELNIEDFFHYENVDKDIGIYYNEVESNLEEMKKVLKLQIEPKFAIGGHCNNPYKCPFASYCKKSFNEDHVENLTRISDKKRKQLNDLNVKYIKDIPDFFELTVAQKIQAKCASENKRHIDKEAIKEFLSQLVYPLHHLDFEAMNQAVPFLENMGPNQFIVYQSSIHREQEDGEISHTELLHTKKTDAREEMIKYLIKELEGEGSIIVWNVAFEATRIKELGKQFPKYNDALISLCKRMVDIRLIFSKYMIYDHAFQGSSSIKYVLPVLCPTLSYDRLFIKNGNDSQAYYIKLINGEFRGGMYNKVKRSLLEYNRLDTLAMLEILKAVKEMVKD